MNEKNICEKQTEIKLLLYAAATAVGFMLLILAPNAGISVPIFAALQIVCLFFILENRRRLWYALPIFLLAAGSFISGSALWRPWNFLVGIILFAAMFTKLSFKSEGCAFLGKIAARAASAVRYFHLPFKWIIGLNENKAPLVRRVLKAAAIALPCVAALTAVLAGADMVFSRGAAKLLASLPEYFSFSFVWKAVLSVLAALYSVGLICSSAFDEPPANAYVREKQGDLLVINIIYCCILAVYTVFAVIQFRYLFAGAELPYGLSYTEYARKGFFELLGLSGVNIALILFAVNRGHKKSPAAVFGRGLNCYLCAVTAVLLASSFYRMWLYCLSDGLTRLRLFVLGFLVFEAVGLILTFVYIFKPRFNVVMAYLLIGLVYYVLLNIVPTDSIVAKSQVDMYLSGRRTEAEYALSLSSDAAEQLYRLADCPELRPQLAEYFRNVCNEAPHDWRSFNLSRARAAELAEDFAAKR